MALRQVTYTGIHFCDIGGITSVECNALSSSTANYNGNQK